MQERERVADIGVQAFNDAIALEHGRTFDAGPTKQPKFSRRWAAALSRVLVSD